MKNNNFQSLKKPSLLQTIAAVLTAGIMWGSGNVIVRSLLIEGLNEIFLVTARVLIIGTLLFFYYVIFNRDPFDKQLLKEASYTSIASIFLVSWAFIFALQYISSGLVTLLVSSAPIFTVMWVKLLLKQEKISRLKYISVFVGFSGIAYLFITQETGLLNQGNIFLGGSLAFLGVQCIALATVLNRKFAPKYKVSSWLTFQYPLVVFLTLLTFFISGVGIDILNISQFLRLGILVVCNLGAFLSFTWLIQRVSALQVASIDYLVPVVGVSAGVIFLGETFNKNILISGLFIFLSLLLTTKDEFSN
tara:strand:+ start:1096 stop:2010 length:915 start_codon:yes stop_codon:yes gene_type:complete